MTVLYHIGHYGYIFRSLIHKFTYHPDDETVFFIDVMKYSPDTLRAIRRKGAFGDIRIVEYSDRIFKKQKDLKGLERKVKNFFDGVLSVYDIDLKDIDEYYSSSDLENAFVAYLCMNKVRYSKIGDTADYVHEYYCGKNGDPVYYDLMVKYSALNLTSPFSKSIVWLTRRNAGTSRWR